MILGVLPAESHAFWIWSRKQQKWRDPDSVPLSSPGAQLMQAMSFYDEGDYKRAYKEFGKLLKAYADAREAPEAQYFRALCLLKMEKPREAFSVFQKIVDSYPYSSRITEIIEHQLQIAEALIDRANVRLLGIEFDPDTWTEHPSIEMFGKIIENAPYSHEAEQAQYKLGLLFKELNRKDEAIRAFEELVDKYPDSRLLEPAKYQLAMVSAEASLKAEYDQTLSKDAKERFSTFLASHPETSLAREANQELSGLKAKEAEKYFTTAEFYFDQGDFSSAKIYYEQIVKNYAGSEAADKARGRINEMDM